MYLIFLLGGEGLQSGRVEEEEGVGLLVDLVCVGELVWAVCSARGGRRPVEYLSVRLQV